LGAGVAIVAGCSVWRIRIRAESGTRIAGSNDMTGVERATYNRIPTLAGTVLADVVSRAGIAIVAGRAIQGIRFHALARRARWRAALRGGDTHNSATAAVIRVGTCRNTCASAQRCSIWTAATTVLAHLPRRATGSAPTTIEEIGTGCDAAARAELSSVRAAANPVFACLIRGADHPAAAAISWIASGGDAEPDTRGFVSFAGTHSLRAAPGATDIALFRACLAQGDTGIC
jgi:hypothetical protein